MSINNCHIQALNERTSLPKSMKKVEITTVKTNLLSQRMKCARIASLHVPSTFGAVINGHLMALLVLVAAPAVVAERKN